MDWQSVLKYNPNHDPKDGRFTFAGQGGDASPPLPKPNEFVNKEIDDYLARQAKEQLIAPEYEGKSSFAIRIALEEKYPKLDFHGLADVYPFMLREVATQLDRMHDKFPEFVGKLKGVSMPSGYSAVFSDQFSNCWAIHQEGHIWLNPAYWSIRGSEVTPGGVLLTSAYKLAKGLRDSAESDWHPPGCDTVGHVLVHEFGHAVDFIERQSGYRNISLLKQKVRQTLDGPVSNYAKTNDSEWFAETFSWAYTNDQPVDLKYTGAGAQGSDSQKVRDTFDLYFSDYEKFVTGKSILEWKMLDTFTMAQRAFAKATEPKQFSLRLRRPRVKKWIDILKFDEAQHPRVPAGSPQGGEFTDGGYDTYGEFYEKAGKDRINGPSTSGFWINNTTGKVYPITGGGHLDQASREYPKDDVGVLVPIGEGQPSFIHKLKDGWIRVRWDSISHHGPLSSKALDTLSDYRAYVKALGEPQADHIYAEDWSKPHSERDRLIKEDITQSDLDRGGRLPSEQSPKRKKPRFKRMWNYSHMLKGDFVGHPFRGNQYTYRSGSGKEARSKWSMEELLATQASRSADYYTMQKRRALARLLFNLEEDKLDPQRVQVVKFDPNQTRDSHGRWAKEPYPGTRVSPIVSQIVGRRHASDSNRAVINYTISRLKHKRKTFFGMDKATRKDLLKQIVTEHWRNRKQYEVFKADPHYLSRYGIGMLGRVQKAGFDPNQPRNPKGEWSATGEYIGHRPSKSTGFRATIPGMGSGMTFYNQKEQYPKKGPPGIGYFKGELDTDLWVDCLLYRDEKGVVVGILNHFPKDMPPYERKGNVTVFVDPKQQRKGIATQLIREAGKRWDVNLAQQDYTPEGAALVNALVFGRKTKKFDPNQPRDDHGRWIPSSGFRLLVDPMVAKRPYYSKYSNPYYITMLKNPSRQEVSDWAGGTVEEVRFLVSSKGDVFVWDAKEALHDQVQGPLGTLNMDYLTGEGYPVRTQDLHEAISAYQSRVQEKYKDKPLPTEFMEGWKVTKFDPNQPRAPKGAASGGQWVSQTSSPEFKEWFGDSKVVDSEGKPLRVYHHTYEDFDTFKPGGFDPQLSGIAIWATTEPDAYKANFAHQHWLAVGRGKGVDAAGNPISPQAVAFSREMDESWRASEGTAAHRRAQIQEQNRNVIRERVRQALQREGGMVSGINTMPVYVSLKKPKVYKDISRGTLMYPDDVAKLKAQGFDGVMTYDKGKLSEVIAFAPEQIKSATGNRGTFDRSFQSVLKFNPYHDEKTGRFTTAENAADTILTSLFEHTEGGQEEFDAVADKVLGRSSVGALEHFTNRADDWDAESRFRFYKLPPGTRDYFLARMDLDKARNLSWMLTRYYEHRGLQAALATNMAKATFYHGTTQSVLTKILQEGVSNHPQRRVHDSSYYVRDDRASSVYLVNDFGSAKSWAESAKNALGGDTVILKIRIPKEERAKLKQDEYFKESARTFRIPRTIPPEWIVAYNDGQWKSAAAKRNQLHPDQRKAAEDNEDGIYYLVIVILPEATQKQEWSTILKFNPYHADDGRFTTSSQAVQPGHRANPTVDVMGKAIEMLGPAEFEKRAMAHLMSLSKVPEGEAFAQEIERVARSIVFPDRKRVQTTALQTRKTDFPENQPSHKRDWTEDDEAKHPRGRDGKWIDSAQSGDGMYRDKEKVWRYYGDDSAVPDAVAQRLSDLKVPPGWHDVRLNGIEGAALQAQGFDDKGRLQYWYSAAHSEQAAAEKLARLKDFTKALPKLQKEILRQMTAGSTEEERDTAAVLRLIEKTGFRPGSENDTGGEKRAFGATTLLAEHVTVTGNRITFNFIGKKGVQIDKTIDDAMLATYLRPKIEKGGKLFNTDAHQVLRFIKNVTGDEFKTKDFRTWHGTAKAQEYIQTLPVPENDTQYRRQRAEVAKIVASHLGNTPAVALSAYIDPAVFKVWGKAPAPTKRKKEEAVTLYNLMQEFCDTHHYDVTGDWRSTPETAFDPEDDEYAAILKGDFVGHPFRGNQWTKGGGLQDERGEGSEAPPPGTPFIVYRLASDKVRLENSNAGNAMGVATHLARIDDFDKPANSGGSGDMLHAYKVTVNEPFGKYGRYIGGRYSAYSWEAQDADKQVGRDAEGGVINYSFPAGSNYTAEHVAAIPLSEVRAKLKARGYASFDDSGTIIGSEVIRSVFRNKIREATQKWDEDQPRDEKGRWVSIPMGARGNARHNAPAVMYHDPRARGFNKEGGIDAYPFTRMAGGAEIAAQFPNGNKDQGFVYLSPTPMSENSVAVDLTQLNTDELRYTGQAEGYVVYRGSIPPKAIKSKTQKFNPNHDERGRFTTGGVINPVPITPEVAAHKGMQMVSVVELDRFKTQDRRKEHKSPDALDEPTAKLLPQLTKTLRTGGSITEPLLLAYDEAANKMLLLDGNTRLAAAQDAGFTHVPVIVTNRNLHGWGAAAPKQHHWAGEDWTLPTQLGLSVLPTRKWDEAQHPREPAGSSTGGQFASKDVAVGNYPGGGWDSPESQAWRKREADWEQSIKMAITEGRLSQAAAKALGMHWSGGEEYVPLPREVWHVTTANDEVLKNGLKTRDEQVNGNHGLGGGSSDTISVTDNEAMAKDYLSGMLEMHDLLNGKISIPELIAQAKAGERAQSEWWSQLNTLYAKESPDVLIDGMPSRLYDAIHGTKTWHTPYANERQAAGEKTSTIETLLGMGGNKEAVGAQVFQNEFRQRKATEKEKLAATYEFMSRWQFMRESYGKGPTNPFFFTSNMAQFKAIPRNQITLLKLQTAQGSQGYHVAAEHEYRIHSGKVLKVVTQKWDESQHPREPAGSAEGGQFRSAEGSIASMPDGSTVNILDEDFPNSPMSRAFLMHNFAKTKSIPENEPVKDLLGKLIDLSHAKMPRMQFIHDVGKMAKPVSAGNMREPNRCYNNSLEVMMDSWGTSDKVEYIEGYITEHGIPLAHAWNTINGLHVDSTVRNPDGHQYMGVLIPRKVLMKIVTTNRFGSGRGEGVIGTVMTYSPKKRDALLKEIREANQ